MCKRLYASAKIKSRTGFLNQIFVNAALGKLSKELKKSFLDMGNLIA